MSPIISFINYLQNNTNQTQLRYLGYLGAFGGVGLVTTFYSLIFPAVGPATIALSFLLIVLITSIISGLTFGIIASIASVLSYQYFFLFSTKFRVEESQGWIDFSVFLVTAIITSQFSAAIRTRAYEAEKGKAEVSRLYKLSKEIIATTDSITAVSSIAKQVKEIFKFKYCAIFLQEDNSWQKLDAVSETSSARDFTPLQQIVDKVGNTNELMSGTYTLNSKKKKNKKQEKTLYVPIKIGDSVKGVMVVISTEVEQGTIEAITGLVALALERANFLQEVSRAEALRQSDELKSAILASVSHGLRTPLTAIRASIDNLLQDDIDWEPEMLREFHLIINEETYRLTRIVRNLLEMARIEGNNLNPNKQSIHLSELVGEVLDRCSVVTRNHKVKVDVPDTLPSVLIDFPMMTEVLTNLVENAAKYSPEATEIKISAIREGDQMIIQVKDQGQGIPSDDLNHIFDKFYRGSQSQYSEGTGMGLAIAKGIAHAHGGKIWVETELGKGTTFHFTLLVDKKELVETISTKGDL
jgi:two-component system, OmpR family, sensor histidine kinase KdpD